jgi:glycosyltransferase involved in cell wall biosynthesis
LNINLPNLNKYRSAFKLKGVPYPLSVVNKTAEGLLGHLPSPPADKSGWPWTQQTDPRKYDTNINWPKLTIVTPSYNQGRFIEETIRTILLQNYPNLEYIVIDGGSSDNTKRILEKYAPWISHWQSEKDNGQSHAINLGFSLASGQYHAWINSDDYYLQDVFHLVISRFLQSKAEFVYGYGYNKNADDGTLNLNKLLPVSDYFIKIPSLIQPSCFWDVRIHQPVWEDLHCAMDYELWLRMVKGKTKSFIKQPLSVAYVHDEAKTSNEKMKVKWEEDHIKMWSAEGHGQVPEWRKIAFLNRIRMKLYRMFNLI